MASDVLVEFPVRVRVEVQVGVRVRVDVQIDVGVGVRVEVLAAQQDRGSEEHPSDDQRDQVRVDQQLDSPDMGRSRPQPPSS